MENQESSFQAVMYDGALRGWWFGVIAIAVFVIFAIAWRMRNR
ncbi:hypothetical protein ACIP10_22140 [Streptomyces galbus]